MQYTRCLSIKKTKTDDHELLKLYRTLYLTILAMTKSKHMIATGHGIVVLI